MLTKSKFPNEIAKDIALKEKSKRKKIKLTQVELSARAGVSLASLKRFEQTGEISFVSLLKLAAVLNELDDFEKLFSNEIYESMEDLPEVRKTTGIAESRLRKIALEIEEIVEEMIMR